MSPLFRRISTFRCDSIVNLSRRLTHARVTAKCIRRFSQSPACRSEQYSKTIPHLDIGAHTRVIFQGFTGRQATQNAKQSLEYGTKIVGGVTPGKDGEHLGLPVLPTVRAAKEHLNPDATAVYVAAGQAPSAIEEAIEAEIPLIVAVAEHIPTIDLVRIREILNTQSRSRLVGPNSPGIISAVGRCRIGFQPLPCFQPGVVGIVARSGTLSYETVASTTRAGLGQSLVIGMGGDILPGTDFVDALTLFEHHEDTKGIILVGEIGGESELRAAQWIGEYRKRVKQPKPIMALIAGHQAPSFTVMGHAGAFARTRGDSASGKREALEDEGVVLVDHPSKFGNMMKHMLDEPDPRKWEDALFADFLRTRRLTYPLYPVFGRRGVHTSSRRPVLSNSHTSRVTKRLGHFLSSEQGLQLLRAHQLAIMTEKPADHTEGLSISIEIDRATGCLEITTSYAWEIEGLNNLKIGAKHPIDALSKSNSFDKDVGKWRWVPKSFIFLHLYEDFFKENITLRDPTGHLVKLMGVFINEGVFSMLVHFHKAHNEAEKVYKVSDATIGVDSPVFQGPKFSSHGVERQEVEQSKLSLEEKAAKDGIVYVTLPRRNAERHKSRTIGTLVNGAGLAMNTIDAVTALGGKCANFLDTGGKATSATVKTSFELVLSDPRVKVIFVNIFGGLTRCDMIAEGIMLAYKDLGITVPVVVRLRGTNEEIGQKMIAESGLPLHAFDDFEEAALKAIELSGIRKEEEKATEKSDLRFPFPSPFPFPRRS